jgi:hypothetical protein
MKKNGDFPHHKVLMVIGRLTYTNSRRILKIKGICEVSAGSLGARLKQGIHARREASCLFVNRRCLSRPYRGEASQMNFLAQSTHKRTMPFGVGTKPVAPISDFGKDASHRSQLTVSCESSSISLAP